MGKLQESSIHTAFLNNRIFKKKRLTSEEQIILQVCVGMLDAKNQECQMAERNIALCDEDGILSDINNLKCMSDCLAKHHCQLSQTFSMRF